jgi:hypothetical protein
MSEMNAHRQLSDEIDSSLQTIANRIDACMRQHLPPSIEFERMMKEMGSKLRDMRRIVQKGIVSSHKVDEFEERFSDLRHAIDKLRATRIAPQEVDEEIKEVKHAVIEEFGDLNGNLSETVRIRAVEAIKRRGNDGYRFKNEQLADSPSVRRHKIAGQLMPNFAVQSEVAIVRPATIEEVERTRQLTTATNFRLDVWDPNAALHILGAIAQHQNLEFAIVPQPDAKVVSDSWNNPSDFAMANGIITEGSLSILGSTAPQHQAKGFALHLAKDLRSVKATRADTQAFVADVKAKIAQLYHVPIDQIIITSLREGSTIVDFTFVYHGLPPATRPLAAEYEQVFGDNFLGCTIHPSFVQLQIQPETFAPEWNRDFSIAGNCPVNEHRGRIPYKPPAGWKRFGLKVIGKFADGDTWLGSSNGPGEWCVAYHGTPSTNVRSITENPLRAGPVNAYGYGIYCTPDYRIAESYTRDTLVLNTQAGPKRFKYIFMCRVNTSSICHCQTCPCPHATDPRFTVHMTTAQGYWFVNANNAQSRCIRPYGILIKEVQGTQQAQQV